MNAGEKIYADLNRPARVRPQRVHERPIKSSRWDQANGRTMTDARRFRQAFKVNENAEDVILTTRRNNVDLVQRWIDENDPSPFDILRKIASVSQPHRKLLTTIAEELEKIVLKPRPPSVVNTRSREVSAMKVESVGVQGSIESLEKQRITLNERIEQLKTKKQELSDELELLQRASATQTFEEGNKVEVKEPTQADTKAEAKKKRKRQARYNELWGENRHLRTELEIISERLEHERKLHDMYAEYRASAIVAAKQVQSVDTTPEPAAPPENETAQE